MNVSVPTRASETAPNRPQRKLTWRVVDIVVASVLGVASGLVFLLWNVGSIGPSESLSALLPGLQGLLDGPWLFAGVLGALVIRKPGAALYTEFLAAAVSAFVGNQWGSILTFEAGLVQGLGAELVFLIFFYRRWNVGVAILAGIGAALAGGVNNLVLWYSAADAAFTVIYLISTCVGGAVVAGALSWFLARGIAATGALDRFASGRSARTRV